MADSRTETTTVSTPDRLGIQSIDVPVVLGYLLLAAVSILSGMVGGTTRLLVSLPVLFFIPGYALLTVLFPGERTGPAWTEGAPLSRRWRGGISWGERVALSVATSLGLLVLLGILLPSIGIALSAGPIVVSIGLLTIVWMGIGWFRRLRMAPDQRLTVPVHRWTADVRDGLWGSHGRIDAGLNVLLAIGIAVAVAGLVFGIAAPERGEAYTEAALLTAEGDSLVAGNFSTDLRPGDPFNATYTIENHQGSTQAYTLVVRAERIRVESDQAVVVEDQQLLTDEFQVADGTLRRAETSVRPTLVGRDLRLSYYLYLDQPDRPISSETADEHLYLWIDVVPAGSDGNATAISSPETG